MNSEDRDKRDEFIISLAKEGHTLADIARWTNSSVSTAQRVLNQHHKSKREIQADVRSEIIRLQESGYKPRDIRDTLGVKVGLVYHTLWVHRHG